MIALRKKTIWKSMKNYSFILFFGVWRLQNFRNRHEKHPIWPQNKVGRIPHTVSTRVWPSSELHTSYNIYIARPYAYAHIDMNSSTSYPHTVFLHIYSKREDAEQRKIMQENYPDTDIFLVLSARNHALWNAYIAEKWGKKHGKCRIHPTTGMNPTPYPSPEIPNV